MARHTRTARTRPREHEEVDERTFGQEMEQRHVMPSGELNGRRIWRFYSH